MCLCRLAVPEIRKFLKTDRDTIKQDEGIPGYIGEYTFTREYSD